MVKSFPRTELCAKNKIIKAKKNYTNKREPQKNNLPRILL
jgi:hypothetical protein